jgi:transcriptional regulator with XRE-family HTH domain
MNRPPARQKHRQKVRITAAERAQFAERLTEAMRQGGLTIAETARRVRQHLGDDKGFSDANLVHYRQGRSVPRLRYLEALSLALGISQSDLISVDPASQPGSANHTEEGSVRSRRSRVQEHALARPAANDSSPPAQPLVTHVAVAIEDHGDEAHVRIDQRVPWPVALQILRVVKGTETAKASKE